MKHRETQPNGADLRSLPELATDSLREPIGKSDVQLHSGQIEALKKIEGIIEKKSERKKVILIHGLEGSGVTYLLEAAREKIEREGAEIISPTQLAELRRRRRDNQQSTNATLVEDNTPQIIVADDGARNLDLSSLTDFKVHEVKMQGMTQKDSESFVEGLDVKNPYLTRRQIVKWSLGIPKLAQLLAEKDIDSEVARRLAIKYVNKQSQILCDSSVYYISPTLSFLQSPIPWQSYPLERHIAKPSDKKPIEEIADDLLLQFGSKSKAENKRDREPDKIDLVMARFSVDGQTKHVDLYWNPPESWTTQKERILQYDNDELKNYLTYRFTHNKRDTTSKIEGLVPPLRDSRENRSDFLGWLGTDDFQLAERVTNVTAELVKELHSKLVREGQLSQDDWAFVGSLRNFYLLEYPPHLEISRREGYENNVFFINSPSFDTLKGAFRDLAFDVPSTVKIISFDRNNYPYQLSSSYLMADALLDVVASHESASDDIEKWESLYQEFPEGSEKQRIAIRAMSRINLGYVLREKLPEILSDKFTHDKHGILRTIAETMKFYHSIRTESKALETLVGKIQVLYPEPPDHIKRFLSALINDQERAEYTEGLGGNIHSSTLK